MTKRKTPLRSLYFDDGGRLWVELNVGAGLDRQANVFGAGGALLAHNSWPARVQLDPPASVYGKIALGIERVVRVSFE